MTETKKTFTPGPWPAPEKTGDGKRILIEKYGPNNDNWNRLSVEVDSDDCDSDTAMANALLITAAPDLLEACKEALDAIDGNYAEVGQMLRAAIAKATAQPS